MNMLIVGDLTRAHHGTEAALVGRMLQELDGQGSFLFLALTNQASAIESSYPEQSVEIINAILPEAGVAEWIRRAENGVQSGTTTIAVFTFHRAILELASELSGSVALQPMSRFTLGGQGPAGTRLWPDSVMPLEEALELLVSVLQSAGGTLHKTTVRNAMAAVDSRLRRSASPAAAQPGIITTLLAAAETNGLVRQAGAEPKILVELADMSARTLPAATAATADDRSRSSQFIDIMRQEGLGFQAARLNLYEQMERLVEAESPTVERLVSEAVAATRRQMEGDLDGSFPWSGLQKALDALLLRRPVLIGQDGVPVATDWIGLSKSVAGFTPSWREELEGEHLLAIARTMAIYPEDLADLAGALYLARGTEQREMVLGIVRHLLATGEMVQDGSRRRLLVVGPQPRGATVTQLPGVAAVHPGLPASGMP